MSSFSTWQTGSSPYGTNHAYRSSIDSWVPFRLFLVLDLNLINTEAYLMHCGRAILLITVRQHP